MLASVKLCCELPSYDSISMHLTASQLFEPARPAATATGAPSHKPLRRRPPEQLTQSESSFNPIPASPSTKSLIFMILWHAFWASLHYECKAMEWPEAPL